MLLAAARVMAWFNPKVARGLAGRRAATVELRDHYSKPAIGNPRLLCHVASYGELEQAKPVISELRRSYPNIHIHLTFFSPSGYENVVGKYEEVDVISYLPLDLRADVSSFLDLTKPDLVLFARYDVWPNFAAELARRKTPTILFSATASNSSRRMLPLVSGLLRRTYSGLTKLLTISEADKAVFTRMGVPAEKIAAAGDTRFDQVVTRKERVARAEGVLPDGIVTDLQEKGTLVFVMGSAWPEDEAIIRASIQQSIERGDNILAIVVPHEPTDANVRDLLADYPQKAIRFSELSNYQRQPIIIVDSIGKLFGLYRYADIAMIGGGFGAGVHNVLEASVWGVPVIVGPNHRKSQEVQRLIDSLAAFEVGNAKEFDFAFWQLVVSEDLRSGTGEKGQRFVEAQCGATHRIMNEITSVLST